VDAFAIVVFGGLLALVVCVWFLGTHASGSGQSPLGLRAPRQIVEEREALEAEDLDELLEATNARRRARGLPERTRADVQREFGPGAGG
jgi:hypothetical protein